MMNGILFFAVSMTYLFLFMLFKWSTTLQLNEFCGASVVGFI